MSHFQKKSSYLYTIQYMVILTTWALISTKPNQMRRSLGAGGLSANYFYVERKTAKNSACQCCYVYQASYEGHSYKNDARTYWNIYGRDIRGDISVRANFVPMIYNLTYPAFTYLFALHPGLTPWQSVGKAKAAIQKNFLINV